MDRKADRVFERVLLDAAVLLRFLVGEVSLDPLKHGENGICGWQASLGSRFDDVGAGDAERCGHAAQCLEGFELILII